MASLLVDRAAARAVSQREFVVLLSEMIPASVPSTLWLKELGG
jgi:hypothetical protein